DYRAIVYQMGNNHGHHRFVYETLLRHPGVVTLHDFRLAGFLQAYAQRTRGGLEYLRCEVEHFCPERAGEVVPHLPEWTRVPWGMHVECGRRGFDLNRRIFERSRAVVVHSPWCRDRVRALFPEHLERTVVIPHGAEAASR